MRHYGTIKFPN